MKNYSMYRINGEYDEADQLFPTLKRAAIYLKSCYPEPHNLLNFTVEGLYTEGEEIKGDHLPISQFIKRVSPTEEDIKKATEAVAKNMKLSREQNELWQKNRKKAKEEGREVFITGCFSGQSSVDSFAEITEEQWAKTEKVALGREIERYSWVWDI